MNADLKIKRGDTLELSVLLKDDESNPIDLDIANITCQMRDKNKVVIDDFSISQTNEVGKYLFKANGDEKEYPLGILYIDIEFNINEKIISSETFTIEIVEDITREEETEV